MCGSPLAWHRTTETVEGCMQWRGGGFLKSFEFGDGCFLLQYGPSRLFWSPTHYEQLGERFLFHGVLC